MRESWKEHLAHKTTKVDVYESLTCFRLLVVLTTALSMSSPADAQNARAPSDSVQDTGHIPAEARAAAREVAEAHEKERQQRNELQQLALELENMRSALIAVASSPSDVSSLSDQVQRTRASLGVFKARALQRAEFSSAAAVLDDPTTRLFAAVDAILSTTDENARALKAATLVRELDGASPEAVRSIPPAPTNPSSLLDDVPIATRQGSAR